MCLRLPTSGFMPSLDNEAVSFAHRILINGDNWTEKLIGFDEKWRFMQSAQIKRLPNDLLNKYLVAKFIWQAVTIERFQTFRSKYRPKKLIKRITTNFIDWRRIEGLAGEGLLHTSFSVSILYLQINHYWHRGGFAKLIIEIMIRALLNVLFKSYLSPFRAESRMAQQESKNCHGVKTTRLDLSSHLRTSVCFTKINYARYQMLCYQSPKST